MSIYFSHCFYVHFINSTFSSSYSHACLDSVTSRVQAWLNLERNYWQNAFLFPVSDFITYLLTQFLTFVSESRNLGIVNDPPSFPSTLWFSLGLSLSTTFSMECSQNLYLTWYCLLFLCLYHFFLAWYSCFLWSFCILFLLS